MTSNRMGSFVSALAGATVVAVVFAVLVATGTVSGPAETGTAPAPAGSEQATADASATVPDVAGLYERARPGVVDVQVCADRRTATGSGFVVDDEGTIITNEHVVDDARTARVRFAGQDEPVTARVLGTDPSTDLAALRVDADDVRGGLRRLELGSSEDVRVGQPAIAMGNPFGMDGTLTVGVVSGIERDMRAPNGFTIDRVVQTDAAINPGNSGGPLLDARGRVVGVNAQRAGGTGAALGLAIPVDTVREVLPALRRGERIERPYLGVSTARPENRPGARVAEVVDGGPADRGGLRAGDVITRVGDTRVGQPEDVARAIASRSPGDQIEITFVRDGDERSETVRLGTRPQEAPR
jgi:putative serine protease PepD